MMVSDFVPKINTVCNIFAKDGVGRHRKLFSVEGDKSLSDNSIYFIVWNDTRRESITKYSFHAWLNNGLVQTHVGEDKLRLISKRYQKPLVDRDRAIFSIHGINDIEDLPTEKILDEDILLSIKPEYLGDCTYLFYTSQESLYKYARQHREIILHNYNIPTKFIAELNFGVLIQEKILRDIQSK